MRLSIRPVQESWLENGRRGLFVHFSFKIGRFEFKISNGSLRPWGHFKVHRYAYHTHVVAGRVSLEYGRPGLEEVALCAQCGSPSIGEVSAGDEGWTVCRDCGSVEQGYERVTLEEAERRGIL